MKEWCRPYVWILLAVAAVVVLALTFGLGEPGGAHVNESPLSASQTAQAALSQATPLIWLWIGLGVVLGVGVLAGILYIRQRLGA